MAAMSISDAILCTEMPDHTLGCFAIRWDALPYIRMPCHTLGCLAIHRDAFHALGRLAIHWNTKYWEFSGKVVRCQATKILSIGKAGETYRQIFRKTKWRQYPLAMPFYVQRCLTIHWDALPYIGMPCHTLGCLAIH